MKYATQQDIIDRYGEEELNIIFDRDLDNVIDDNAVDRALQDASDEIDAYLAGRYSLPLEVVPTVLTRACVDIALYLAAVGNAATEERRQRYQDQIKLLDKVASGKINLGLAAVDEPPDRDDVHVSAPDREFGSDTLEKF